MIFQPLSPTLHRGIRFFRNLYPHTVTTFLAFGLPALMGGDVNLPSSEKAKVDRLRTCPSIARAAFVCNSLTHPHPASSVFLVKARPKIIRTNIRKPFICYDRVVVHISQPSLLAT